MKRIFFLWIYTLVTGFVYSQTIEQVITENRSLTANNYQAYPEPTWQQSPAPRGMCLSTSARTTGTAQDF